jgi:hypothetical protein
MTLAMLAAACFTFGLAEDIGPRSGFVAITARGKYSPGMIRKLIMKEPREGLMEVVDEVEVFRPDPNVALILPSEDRFVLLACEGADEVIPYEPMVKALKGNEKGVTAHEEMAKLLRSVDRTKPIWAIARMTPAYRQAPFLAPFDTITLEGDEKDGVLKLKLIAKGKDVEGIKTAVAQFEMMRQEALREMKNQVETAPLQKTAIDFMESVKVDSAGQAVTITADWHGGRAGTMSLPVMFWAMRSIQMRHEVHQLAPVPAN